MTQSEQLTTQEKKVLEMIAEGLSSKQIAARPKLSENTIENHRKNMLRKTNCKNIAQLVRYATLNNII